MATDQIISRDKLLQIIFSKDKVKHEFVLPRDVFVMIRTWLWKMFTDKEKKTLLNIVRANVYEGIMFHRPEVAWVTEKLRAFNTACLLSTAFLAEILHSCNDRMVKFEEETPLRRSTIMAKTTTWCSLEHLWDCLHKYARDPQISCGQVVQDAGMWKEVFERVLSKVELRPLLETAIDEIEKSLREDRAVEYTELGGLWRTLACDLEMAVWFWYAKRLAERILRNIHIPHTEKGRFALISMRYHAQQIIDACEGLVDDAWQHLMSANQPLPLPNLLHLMGTEKLEFDNMAKDPRTPMWSNRGTVEPVPRGLHPNSFSAAHLKAPLPHMYPLEQVDRRWLGEGMRVSISNGEQLGKIQGAIGGMEYSKLKLLLCSENFAEHAKKASEVKKLWMGYLEEKFQSPGSLQRDDPGAIA